MLRRQKKAEFGKWMKLGPGSNPAATLQMGCLYDTLHCIDGNSEVKYASSNSRNLRRLA